MSLHIYSSRYFEKLKATIQKSGLLCFSTKAARAMALDEDTYFLIGKDDDVNADLILVKHHLSPAPADTDMFRIKRSTTYFYLQTTTLFAMLGYDFISGGSLYFDIVRAFKYEETEHLENEVFFLYLRKSTPRRKKKSNPRAVHSSPK